MTIRATSEHTKLAISMASKITTNSETASQLASIVGDCKDSYIDALDNLKEMMNALPSRDVGIMNSMLSAAIMDFSDCDDEFSGLNSPLLEFDAKLTKMTSNGLALIKLWSFIVVEVHIGC
ncbi:hypothetical protein Acr_29g0008940 [Actinidia rufa]|uniref:Pectinesterase inhibitor domain-containing protein n=1 Tax=Actinidia rufa TaxID=165716 RepID=A0A7J0HFA0_9ERIC|nr:hypothetical protein Acr_29g0008940 [Actinidia rufa]